MSNTFYTPEEIRYNSSIAISALHKFNEWVEQHEAEKRAELMNLIRKRTK